MVLGATRDAGGTHITVVDPAQPQEGRMVMRFAEAPIALSQWTITTKTGQRTTRCADRAQDRRRAGPQPLQHRARRREPPLRRPFRR